MTDDQQAATESTPNPDCDDCSADAKLEAVAQLRVGSLGLNLFLCSLHLQQRQSGYDAALIPSQMTSLVRVPTSAEEKYAEVVQDLRDAQQREKERTAERDGMTADHARIAIDNERLARMVAQERLKAADMETALKDAAAQIELLQRELAKAREENFAGKLQEALARVDELTDQVGELERALRGVEPGEAARTEPPGSAAETGGAVVEGSAGGWHP